jgi:hypothetical protein
MSVINPLKHKMLMQEAKRLLNRADFDSKTGKEGITVLSQEDIFEWMQVFEEDRIMLDGCNHAIVQR